MSITIGRGTYTTSLRRAVWAFLALGPLSGFVLVWAGFIGWGCFFHTGGDNKALTKTIGHLPKLGF